MQKCANQSDQPPNIHVCMVSWRYSPMPEGGSEKQCRILVEKFAEQGMECTVLTAFLDRNIQQIEDTKGGCRIVRLGALASVASVFDRLYNIMHHWPWCGGFESEVLRFWLSIPFSLMARFSFMLSLRKYLKINGKTIDILHVHEAHWIAGAVAWACKGMDIPVVCKEATYPFAARLGYDTPLRATLSKLRKNLHFIALTDSVQESLLVNGIKAEKITLIPNGVEVPHRQAKVIDSDTIIYIGNFTQGVRLKAFDVLFQAWVQVHAERPDLSLIVLGGGDYSYWQSYLRENQCSASVQFMGAVPDVGIYLEKARVFVLPSRVEGLSNALLEAMSWGVPVVVSDIPSHNWLIRHKFNGMICPVNNSGALAEALLELAVNDELALAVAAAGRKTIIEKFSIEKTAVSLVELYLDLLNYRRKI